MQTVFQVDGIRQWHLEFSDFEANAVTAILTVETSKLRHVITAYGLEDSRTLDEVSHGYDALRILYDVGLSPQYVLEICYFGREPVGFPITTYGVDTRDLNQRRHKFTE
jgi:hypothetical protein